MLRKIAASSSRALKSTMPAVRRLTQKGHRPYRRSMQNVGTSLSQVRHQPSVRTQWLYVRDNGLLLRGCTGTTQTTKTQLTHQSKITRRSYHDVTMVPDSFTKARIERSKQQMDQTESLKPNAQQTQSQFDTERLYPSVARSFQNRSDSRDVSVEHPLTMSHIQKEPHPALSLKKVKGSLKLDSQKVRHFSTRITKNEQPPIQEDPQLSLIKKLFGDNGEISACFIKEVINAERLEFNPLELKSLQKLCNVIYERREFDDSEKLLVIDLIAILYSHRKELNDKFYGEVKALRQALMGRIAFKKLVERSKYKLLPYEDEKGIKEAWGDLFHKCVRIEYSYSNYTNMGMIGLANVAKGKAARNRKIFNDGHPYFNRILIPVLGKEAAVIGQQILFFGNGGKSVTNAKERAKFAQAAHDAKHEKGFDNPDTEANQLIERIIRR